MWRTKVGERLEIKRIGYREWGLQLQRILVSPRKVKPRILGRRIGRMAWLHSSSFYFSPVPHHTCGIILAPTTGPIPGPRQEG